MRFRQIYFEIENQMAKNVRGLSPGPFRKKIYSSVEELQKDVDQWLKYDNEVIPHSGIFCYGKAPMQTFRDSKRIALEKSNEKMYFQEQTDKCNLNFQHVSQIIAVRSYLTNAHISTKTAAPGLTEELRPALSL